MNFQYRVIAIIIAVVGAFFIPRFITNEISTHKFANQIGEKFEKIQIGQGWELIVDGKRFILLRMNDETDLKNTTISFNDLRPKISLRGEDL